MPSIIEAEQQNLVKVFSDDYFFEIPFYQRPYSWQEEQVRELLDDLIEGMKRDEEEPYFLGSVVLIKRHDDPRSQVVDGQQRLTTLTMLLCVLRELADPKDALLLDKSIRESANTYQGTQERFRVALREQDREFFQKRIQTPQSLDSFLSEDPVSFSDSQRLLQKNTSYVKSKLSELSEDSRKDFARYIIQKCCLVVVAASEGESAHRIFQVMNDRGLELSPTDILKSEILSQIPPVEQERYSDRWELLEDELGRERFRDLFGHIRMIDRKAKAQGTLQSEIREGALKRVKTGQEFIEHVLEPYGDVYQTVVDALYESSEGADRINALLRHLGRLREFRHVDWISPAMAYYHRNGSDRESLFRFTKDLERLAYGMFVRRAYLNDRINRFAQVLRAIEQDSDLFAEDSPLQLSPEEKSDIVHRLNGNIYNQYGQNGRPLLLRLDSLLADAGVNYTPSVISVEHVLPQNPADDSEWITLFPNAEERSYWTHRLANLVLLSRRKNARASNWDFGIKKDEYFGKIPTTFALTTQVVAETKWTPEVLERRQEYLIDTLKKEWRLD